MRGGEELSVANGTKAAGAMRSLQKSANAQLAEGDVDFADFWTYRPNQAATT
jgi:hypothetical protein